jgi:CBS domain-containing protein
MHQLATIGTRQVVTVLETTSVADIAHRMHETSVGSVVVMQGSRPVGIVTDRDLVLRVLYRRADPLKTTAKDVMSAPLATISEGEDALSAASIMREKQVRRLPVVRKDGSLAGIICMDDLIHHLSRTHHELSEAIAQFPVTYAGG